MSILIERKLSTAPASAYSPIATLPLTNTSYADSGLAAATSYDYRITRQVAGKTYEEVIFSATTLAEGQTPPATFPYTFPFNLS